MFLIMLYIGYRFNSAAYSFTANYFSTRELNSKIDKEFGFYTVSSFIETFEKSDTELSSAGLIFFSSLLMKTDIFSSALYCSLYESIFSSSFSCSFSGNLTDFASFLIGLTLFYFYICSTVTFVFSTLIFSVFSIFTFSSLAATTFLFS